MGSWLRWIAPLEPGEGPAVAWSAAFHFCMLGGYYMLRPVREAFGIERGADRLPWLMTATLVAMLLVNPLFAALVSRLPRRRSVPITYRFFAVNLIAFYALFRLLPAGAVPGLGYAFYVWLSVFNLFVVSVYWGLMADLFGRERAVRVFGLVAVGGTLGAIAGAWFTGTVMDGVTVPGIGPVSVGAPTLMLLAVLPLEGAAQCAGRLARLFGIGGRGDGAPGLARADSGEPGPGILDGLWLVTRSPYLLLICVYMFLYTVLSTFLYLEQGRIVETAFADRGARTAAFARIDLWVNVLTLGTQLFLTSAILRRLGIGRALTIVPLITAAGFAALWASPVFGVLMAFQVLRRGLHYGVDRPAREVLYTVLGADEKYKSKPFIDTFVYRGGDMIGAWSPSLLALAPVVIPVAAVAAPLALVWGCVGLGLGSMQSRLARARRVRRCAVCGYDLAGLPTDRCPECGTGADVA